MLAAVTGAMDALAEVGARLGKAARKAWDGHWTLFHFRMPPLQVVKIAAHGPRMRLRGALLAFGRHGSVATDRNRTSPMRLALTAVAIVVGTGAGWAESPETHALRTNHVGCRNPQDLIDFVRMGNQAKSNDLLMSVALRNLFANIDAGLCHQYTEGTPVRVSEKRSVQDFDLECIKDEFQSVCFYILAPAS